MTTPVEIASATWNHPTTMHVSGYTLNKLKQEAINKYFDYLHQSSKVTLKVSSDVVNGVETIKVSVIEFND